MRKIFGVIVFLLLLTNCFGNKTQTTGAYKAYDFTFKDLSGTVHKLSDFRGKVVIVQFFGTYCPPCREEMYALEDIHKRFKDRVVVIGLSVDYVGRDISGLKEFAKQMGVSYLVGVASQRAWEEYAYKITGLDTIPQTFIIDKNGLLRFYETGYRPSYAGLIEKAVSKLLGEG
jgi:peroxiredoxin